MAIQNPYGRSYISLNGLWHIIIDPYETGSRDMFGAPNPRGYQQNRSPDTAWWAEYDFAGSPTLEVPGDWNTQREDLLWYEGTIWYQRNLPDIPADGRRRFIRFGGANYESEVWLNGEPLGKHLGGYTPFEFEVTDHLNASGNFIVVRINNQRHRDAVPTLDSDWWNYGGLTRDVLLLDLPRAFIRDYVVQLVPGTSNQYRGMVQLDGATAGEQVAIEIDGRQLAAVDVDQSGLAEVEFAHDLQLWSPDTPTLHEITVRTATDSVNDRIGFRSIQREGENILLNGKPIQLNGISLHEEALTEPRRAHSEADARELLNSVKKLGCNFARLAHYPHNDHMARVADELGILLWEEVPVYWAIDWENPTTLDNARSQLDSLVRRDRNRASVILWSVANETPVGDARNRFLAALIDHARQLDATRLVTAALFMRSDKQERNGQTIRTFTVDDPLGEHLDVLGCNQYLGWYYTFVGDMDSAEWYSSLNKPLIMSEFGAAGRRGHRGAADERWTEDYQVTVYQAQFAMQRKISFLRGTSPWILKDFRTPKRPLPGIQDYFNRKGLVDEHGRPKAAWTVVADRYAEDP